MSALTYAQFPLGTAEKTRRCDAPNVVKDLMKKRKDAGFHGGVSLGYDFKYMTANSEMLDDLIDKHGDTELAYIGGDYLREEYWTEKYVTKEESINGAIDLIKNQEHGINCEWWVFDEQSYEVYAVVAKKMEIDLIYKRG